MSVYSAYFINYGGCPLRLFVGASRDGLKSSFILSYIHIIQISFSMVVTRIDFVSINGWRRFWLRHSTANPKIQQVLQELGSQRCVRRAVGDISAG